MVNQKRELNRFMAMEAATASFRPAGPEAFVWLQVKIECVEIQRMAQMFATRWSQICDRCSLKTSSAMR
jgi:hypothetical protein